MHDAPRLTRRTLFAVPLTFAGAGAAMAQAQAPVGRRLAFDVVRDRRVIGRHQLEFAPSGKDLVVTIDADIRVALGPLTLFRYTLQAVETWRDGRFFDLLSRSSTNGRREQLRATRADDAVAVRTGAGERRLPRDARPLTHWNAQSLTGPLFNPGTGAPIRASASRQTGQILTPFDGREVGATRVALSGEVQIVDWDDDREIWIALKARARDGSMIDYRRVV